MTRTTPQSDQVLSTLFAAARNGCAAAPEPDNVREYDWHASQRFSARQVDALGDLAAEAAARLSRTLGAKLQEELSLQADAPVQCYAGKLSVCEEETAVCCVGLTTAAGGRAGIAVVTADVAQLWVAKTLGSAAGTSSEERELSTLENCLLLDVVELATRAFSAALRQAGGGELRCLNEISTTVELPEAAETDEYCILAFRPDGETTQRTITFVVASDALAAAVGAEDNHSPDDQPPRDSRADMLAHIEHVTVPVQVYVGTGHLTIPEIMNLEEGDTVLLNTQTDAQVELMVDGRLALLGYPVVCQGQYALQVVGPAETEHETA